MRVQDLVFLFDIEVFSCLLVPDHLHCVVLGMLSLVISVHAFRIFVFDHLVYLGSSAWSAHIILIIINVFVLQVLGSHVEGVSRR